MTMPEKFIINADNSDNYTVISTKMPRPGYNYLHPLGGLLY